MQHPSDSTSILFGTHNLTPGGLVFASLGVWAGTPRWTKDHWMLSNLLSVLVAMLVINGMKLFICCCWVIWIVFSWDCIGWICVDTTDAIVEFKVVSKDFCAWAMSRTCFLRSSLSFSVSFVISEVWVWLAWVTLRYVPYYPRAFVCLGREYVDLSSAPCAFAFTLIAFSFLECSFSILWEVLARC